ncbi:unnamed protein product [Calypogeia fissa]
MKAKAKATDSIWYDAEPGDCDQDTGQWSVGDSHLDACQGGGPFILMNEPRTAGTLKHKDHSRATETRKCIFGRRSSPEHMSLIIK